MTDEQLALLRLALGRRADKDLPYWTGEAKRYGTPVVEKTLFMRECWRPILRKNDTSWIDERIADLESRVGRTDLFALRFLPELPEFREALKRIRDSSVSSQDITTIVREFQLQVLGYLINLLDGGMYVEDGVLSPWSLCATNDDLEPTESFGDMKESIWDFDPDGDET